jgi:hypothetical protein
VIACVARGCPGSTVTLVVTPWVALWRQLLEQCRGAFWRRVLKPRQPVPNPERPA